MKTKKTLCLLAVYIICVMIYYNQPYVDDVEANIPRVNKIIERENLVPAQNITPPSATILMYNKVPKCGSASMLTLIQRLAKINEFSVTGCTAYPRQHSKSQQEEMIKSMMLQETYTFHAFQGHIYFYDDVRDYNGTVTWMNQVRDPVERFISYFYHSKRPDAIPERLTEWGIEDHEAFLNLDLNECAAANHPLCSWKVFPAGELQLSFFCGQDAACGDQFNRWSLERAKQNVEKYYTVVGVLEDLSLTHAVLEAYIPRVFKGAPEVYPDTRLKNVQGYSEQKEVSNATKAILRNNLKMDYEFYEFIRQRLYSQAKTIGLL